ncbi:hypothetical protein FJZ28_04900, partial [Candidatus Peregrinibacteria bacterium]|nr:hypothetical protein [Candidatus Peregrinibacteria bacterium]
MFLLHPDAFLCDLGILLLVAFGASVTVASWVWMRQTESGSVLKAIVGFVGLISFLGFLLTVYGSFIEPRIIVTTHATVTQRLSGGLKIAVVSDLHVGPYTDAAFVRSVVERVNTELPDMVLMPGDFIFGSESNLEDFKPLKA